MFCINSIWIFILIYDSIHDWFIFFSTFNFASIIHCSILRFDINPKRTIFSSLVKHSCRSSRIRALCLILDLILLKEFFCCFQSHFSYLWLLKKLIKNSLILTSIFIFSFFCNRIEFWALLQISLERSFTFSWTPFRSSIWVLIFMN